jgi:hypothetical protein
MEEQTLCQIGVELQIEPFVFCMERFIDYSGYKNASKYRSN